MDPLSVAAGSLALSASLYKVSKTLYSCIEATGNVNRTVSSLQSQVNGLANVLKSLGNTLQHPSLEECAKHNGDLWTDIGKSVDASSTTKDELNQILERVAKPGSNQLKQAWRQVKLGLAQDDIERLVTTTRTHSLNLQLSIGIINVLLCASSPKTVINEQALRFERLERMIVAIDQRLEPADSVQGTTQDGDESKVLLDENTLRLRQRAETVISSASTAAGYSERRRTDVPSLWDIQSAFNYVESSPGNLEESLDSTTGSEAGMPLAIEQKAFINDWIPVVPQIDEESAPSSVDRRRFNSGSDFSEKTISTETQPTEVFSDLFEETSEDDVDYQVAVNISAKAIKEFQANQFSNAEPLLKSFLEHSRRLNYNQQEALSRREMQLKYAVCQSRTGQIEEAEETLLSIAKEQAKSSSDAKRIFEAMHNLALIQLRRRNLEAAEVHCRQALRGRGKTKTMGKTHKDYFTSLRLLSIIIWAKGDKIGGQEYLDLLPPDRKLDTADLDAIASSPELFDDDATRNEIVSNPTDTTAYTTTQKDEDDLSPTTLHKSPLRPAQREHISIPGNEGYPTANTSPRPTISQSPQREENLTRVRPERKRSLDRDKPTAFQVPGSAQNQAISIATASLSTLHRASPPDSMDPSIVRRSNQKKEEQFPDLQKKNEQQTIRRFSSVTCSLSDQEIPGDASNAEPRVEESLHLSSTEAQIAEARAKLIKKGYYKTSGASNGLYWAARNNEFDAVNALLAEFPSLNINRRLPIWVPRPESIYSRVPLHAAAQLGDVRICARLLAAGAELELPDQNGNRPLDVAAIRSNLLMCRLFLQHGACVEGPAPHRRSAFAKAIKSNPLSVALLKLLLDHGANVDAVVTTNTWDGATGLMIAAYRQREDAVQLLLERGANVNMKDKYGDGVVSYCKKFDILLALVDNGVDPFDKYNYAMIKKRLKLESSHWLAIEEHRQKYLEKRKESK